MKDDPDIIKELREQEKQGKLKNTTNTTEETEEKQATAMGGQRLSRTRTGNPASRGLASCMS